MEILKERILKEGRALSKVILKGDSFLNHGVDARLMYEIGENFKEYFKNHGVTKIFTIESSGIAPTVMTAMQMELPMVILKKQTSKVLNNNVYQTTVHSFTKDLDYELTLSKDFIDDFLANGEAALGAIRLVEEAGAKVVGLGIVIEKSFQPGRDLLNKKGYDVYSLARISRLDKGVIEFI